MNLFSARIDGEPTKVELTAEGIVAGETTLAWVDCDEFEAASPTVRFATFDGTEVTITHLATVFDRFVAEVTELRGRARRAALLQWTGDREIGVFDAKRGDERVRVHLFPDAVTIEPAIGVPDIVPLSCLERIERSGYDLALCTRGLADVSIRHLGNRTDEFVQRVERAADDLSRRTSVAYGELDPALGKLPARDGWAIDAAGANQWWEPLCRLASQGHRATEMGWLMSLPDARVRLGIKCGPAGHTLVFALVAVGGRVAVEAADAGDRATFVFAVHDVDRLNFALLATSFRREAIAAPATDLGRWALAVRTLEVVRWARTALVARVVHDERWQTAVTAALKA
ncbi:MAG: hypothetical protein ABI239_01025 [Aquihabitans sp.]